MKKVVKISRVPLDRFCLNLQGFCKKVLSSEPGEFFLKRNSFFYSQKNNEKWGHNFQKSFKHLPCSKKKTLLAHCFDSSKTKISHLFWFKRDFLDNILIATHAKNGIWIIHSGTRKITLCSSTFYGVNSNIIHGGSRKVTMCSNTFYVVAAKITVDTVKCTGTHCNFSSATMNYPNVTMNYPNAVFCVQEALLKMNF